MIFTAETQRTPRKLVFDFLFSGTFYCNIWVSLWLNEWEVGRGALP